MTSATSDIRVKLEAARTRLILDQPFIGALLLQLPPQASADCATASTDGVRLYFNPRFIESLEMNQLQFLLAHQALHCALGHFWRRGHRSRKRWDVACDHAVNLMLVDDGMKPPPGALLDRRFRGLSAEEIYPLLSEAGVQSQLTLDSHPCDFPAGKDAAFGLESDVRDRRPDVHGAAAPALASDDDLWSDARAHARRQRSTDAPAPALGAVDDLAQRWQMRLAMAAQQASRAGRLGQSWQRVLGRLLQPALPWNALLARHVVSRAHEDYSFQRPARREGTALLPRLHSGQMDLFVVLDTSGSVSEEQLNAFAAEIDALKGQVRAKVTLHACDERLAPDGPWVFQPWEPIELPASLRGGAGTDFRPIFEWIGNESARPDLLVYFTDAEGEFPPGPPPYPVLWLVKGPATVPWGERI
ncbi:MAG: hypothetical protein EHM59_12095, partial [Betaproteobacteria bacterium]